MIKRVFPTSLYGTQDGDGVFRLLSNAVRNMKASDIAINSSLTIPASELGFRYSRSGGPGGQHVNKTETKVELLFDVEHSAVLNDHQRAALRRLLGTRMDTAGVLHVVVSQERSQRQNKTIALGLFAALVAAALRPRKKRLATAPTRSSKERRIETKKRHGEIKKLRSRKNDE